MNLSNLRRGETVKLITSDDEIWCTVILSNAMNEAVLQAEYDDMLQFYVRANDNGVEIFEERHEGTEFIGKGDIDTGHD